MESLENERLNSLIEYFDFKYVYTLLPSSSLVLDGYYKFDENCFRFKLNDVETDPIQPSTENNTINNESTANPIVDAEKDSIVEADHYRTVLRQKTELYGFHLSEA